MLNDTFVPLPTHVHSFSTLSFRTYKHTRHPPSSSHILPLILQLMDQNVPRFTSYHAPFLLSPSLNHFILSPSFLIVPFTESCSRASPSLLLISGCFYLFLSCRWWLVVFVVRLAYLSSPSFKRQQQHNNKRRTKQKNK